MAITCFKEGIVNYSRKLGKCTFEKFPLFLHGEVATWEIVIWENVYTWKVADWEIATWKNTLGKLPLGKRPLGKYLTSFE